jgi:hypothetical protein
MLSTYYHEQELEPLQEDKIVIWSQHVIILVLLAFVILVFQKDTLWSLQNWKATLIHYLTHCLLFLSIPLKTTGETIASINR